MPDLDLVAAAPIAHLATIRRNGAPHIVPITFALVDGDIVTAVDHKPKRHHRLQRLDNIDHDPRVAVLIDHWSSEWSELWWARADGTASITTADADAVRALAAKYSQYRDVPPSGPVIRVEVDRWQHWSASTAE